MQRQPPKPRGNLSFPSSRSTAASGPPPLSARSGGGVDPTTRVHPSSGSGGGAEAPSYPPRSPLNGQPSGGGGPSRTSEGRQRSDGRETPLTHPSRGETPGGRGGGEDHLYHRSLPPAGIVGALASSSRGGGGGGHGDDGGKDALISDDLAELLDRYRPNDAAVGGDDVEAVDSLSRPLISFGYTGM